MPNIPSCRPAIEGLSPYEPGEQPALTSRVVKLNTNENPFGPPPAVSRAIEAALEAGLQTYPDPSAHRLRSLAAERFGLGPEAVLVGNGSDEILSLLCRAFLEPGERVVYPQPTYSLYPVLGQIQDAELVEIPFDREFHLPAQALLAAQGRLTFLANPNSPSGTWVELDRLAELAQQTDGILVVDEAYADFAGQSLAPRTAEIPNLLVVRTLSKSFALAGLRVGFLYGHPEVVAKIARLKDSYNLGTLPMAGAEAALEAWDWMTDTCRQIIALRDEMSLRLQSLGFEVLPSAANFVLARIDSPPAQKLWEDLRQGGVYVRYFATPELADALRITVGTAEQNERFLTSLEEILKS